jgi:hypothetical protein
VNIAKAIDLKAGMKAIDCGCGVGGPMRTIAAATGAHVTGITINEYQVKRARGHNEKAGLAQQCTVVQGNFLALPFPENTFDAACVPARARAPLRCMAADMAAPPQVLHRGCVPRAAPDRAVQPGVQGAEAGRQVCFVRVAEDADVRPVQPGPRARGGRRG